MLSAADEWEAEANTVCWVAIDGKLAAVFGVADKIRDEAAQAIKQLRANDVRIVMPLYRQVPRQGLFRHSIPLGVPTNFGEKWCAVHDHYIFEPACTCVCTVYACAYMYMCLQCVHTYK